MTILIDGSNLLYWEGPPPTLDPVLAAVQLLEARGLEPYVMFDASVGHRIGRRYLDADALAPMIGLPASRVGVADKQVQADGVLLQAARDRGAKVITNDLFRDWAKRFPEVRSKGHLVHGGYHKGKLWLDFDGSRPRMHKAR
ncbi:hypothetical protein [uncultured Litoreibacter sp.]|uniref:NYN domain-containing protein n=1 Tax=uncultured Litoreibacter sp. TaxID=1392394 RepID=UPI002632F355|nr:hypothetical protein [uncultured Litoreibacter sp.]